MYGQSLRPRYYVRSYEWLGGRVFLPTYGLPRDYLQINLNYENRYPQDCDAVVILREDVGLAYAFVDGKNLTQSFELDDVEFN